MDLSVLNELMEIQKKADAPKEKKDSYVEQMVVLLKEEGLSQNSIVFIKKGVFFSGAKPVALFMKDLSTEEKESFTDELFKSSLFLKDEKAFVFRFGVSLMAYSLEWIPDCQSLISGLIKRLPAAKYNKDKQQYKDINRLFEIYFIDVISDETDFPCLGVDETCGLREFHVQDFRRLLIECTENVSKKNLNKANKIREWAGLPPVSDTIVEDKKESQSIELNTNQSVTISQPKNDAYNEVVLFERNEIVKEIDIFSKRLILTLGEYEKDVSRKNNEIEQCKRELFITREQLQRSHTKNEQLENEISECRNTIIELNDQIKSYNELGELREEKIKELNSEIARLNTILSVYSVDKQNSQSEQLNAIASKLKAEYRDFKDAENEEMTLNLGENLRCQLQSVFRILLKAGIDIEKR